MIETKKGVGSWRKNGICSAAFCESAVLRETGSPSQSSLRDASSPKGRALGMAAKFPTKAAKCAVSPEPLPLGEVARRKP